MFLNNLGPNKYINKGKTIDNGTREEIRKDSSPNKGQQSQKHKMHMNNAHFILGVKGQGGTQIKHSYRCNH
jgi:hypothetical protein